MPRSFKVPEFYRSKAIAQVKKLRAIKDPKKRDLSPSTLDFGPIKFKLARHFGFCFGVENAIEIAYQAIAENPDKRIFLLSEMIHNPQVNEDLRKRGVNFLMNTDGSSIVPLKSLSKEDIVIVPAFGTTVELQKAISKQGIDPYYYDTTCPFVEKVWKRSSLLGKKGFSVVVHGKRQHEETRATFSHSKETAPTLIILDKKEAQIVCDFIESNISSKILTSKLGQGMSKGFNPELHLKKIGVVNQTTMLASETKEISLMIKESLNRAYGKDKLSEHFADTRDTLCYATNENQSGTKALIESGADIAIVVGGYNSSNTSHLVELFEEYVPTYYIKGAEEILSATQIKHFSLSKKEIVLSNDWLEKEKKTESNSLVIALTSGASCPDVTVDQVMEKILEIFSNHFNYEKEIRAVDDVIANLS